jgi:predicted amidohydrolase
MNSTYRIATAQYNIGTLGSWAEYEAKVRHWVEEAAGFDVKLLVFPEYFSMELASLFPEAVYKSLSGQLDALQDLLPGFQQVFQEQARRHDVHIVAGSYPVRQTDGSFRNRAYLFRPEGDPDFQDKLQMTRFENEQWFIVGGDEIKTFDTPLGRIGINICYDSEFPMLARKQVEAGADLIVVPSCTDTTAGYWRVRIGCQARALENQCYVVQSPTVGLASWSEAVDINIGAAAIYTPVDYGFPDNGVLAIGELNATQWVYAEIDHASIGRIRNTGQVFNYRDWPSQFRCLDDARPG